MNAEFKEYTLDELAVQQKNAMVGGPFGSNLVSKDYTDVGIPVIRGQNMGGRWVSGNFAFVSKAKAMQLSANTARPGDLVFTQRGTLGQVSMVPHCVYETYIVSQSQMKVTINQQLADVKFLYYYFSAPEQIDYVKTNSIQTGVPHTNLGILRKSPVRLPSRYNQKVIANILSSLDDKIELNKNINKTLERMAQAIFKSWFVDFEPVKAKIAAKEQWQAMQQVAEPSSPVCYVDEETPLPDLSTWINLAAMRVISGKSPDELFRFEYEKPEQYAELRATAELFPSAMQDSEMGEVPQGWEASPLSDLFELHRGFDLPQKSRENGPFEVYAAGGLHGTHNQFKMKPPGIITGRSGVIGNVYLSLKKYWPLNTTLYVREFRDSGPYYAYHLLKMLDLKSLNSGSAVPSLNRNFVHSTVVMNPGSEIQIEFERLASSLFTKIVGNIDQNELLTNVRDTLLPKLLSGELTLPNIGTQPEPQDVSDAIV